MDRWTKGLELAKLARRDGQHFDCALRVHKAREMPTEVFRREVEKELTGKEQEPSEIIYFKVYKSQIPVIEQAIDTAALMLGSDNGIGAAKCFSQELSDETYVSCIGTLHIC